MFGKKKDDDSSREEPKKSGWFSRFRKDKSAEDGRGEPADNDAASSSVVADVHEDSPSAVQPTEPVAAGADSPRQEPVDEQAGLLGKLKRGLQKTRGQWSERLGGVFLRSRKIDEDVLEELEEMLISADIGVQTTMDLLESIRKDVDRQVLKDGAQLKEAIKSELRGILDRMASEPFRLDHQPTIVLVVGVNGVGKTTTIGKLAHRFRSDGKSVVLCAADTFRAAAVEQLGIWAQRAQVDIVMKPESTDPAAVVYDAVERTKETGADVLMIDTAGRLHNNPNLMKELEKIYRIIGKSFDKAPHHVLLILDAVTGQNGLQQAKKFVDKVGVTDLIITKLDGTARGGIAVGIAKELTLPIRYIGVGEQMNDLLPFDSDAFVASLFDEKD